MSRLSNRNFYISKSYASVPNLSSARYVQDNNLANQIISQAGPQNVYYRQGYGVSDQTHITTEITHEPTVYNSVHYKINEDPDPVRIVRPTQPVTQRQNVRIRYLDPPEPPTPAPIVIRERQLTPPPPAPPIVIRQQAPPPPTPPPLYIREKPPTPPVMPEPTFIEKIIPPPTPPPRQVIIERIPAPEKPRDIIYEKWLPYKPLPDRKVIVETGKRYEKLPAPRNIIIDYEQPNVNIERTIYDEGIIRADPYLYNSHRPNGELKIVDKITDVPAPTVTNVYYRPSTATTTVITDIKSRPKTSIISSGPVSYTGPWNTTYRTSYTGRGFGRH